MACSEEADQTEAFTALLPLLWKMGGYGFPLTSDDLLSAPCSPSMFVLVGQGEVKPNVLLSFAKAFHPRLQDPKGGWGGHHDKAVITLMSQAD